MHPQIMVPTLQGISAKSVVIKSSAPGYEDFEGSLVFVVKTLPELPPLSILVQLVENQALFF